MTLCIAWIRKDGDEQELVMATDSRLTGGESWDSGVKLFELPRQDCLLCFAGGTERAYPLILNTISAIKFDHHLINQHTDVHDILEYLTELFTDLVTDIKDIGNQSIDEVRAEAEFIFGGWSWKEKSFGIWRLYYNTGFEAFAYESVNQSDARVFTFLGNAGSRDDTQRLVDSAQSALEERLRDAGKLLAGSLDMEPLQVLTEISRDTSEKFRYVGGAIQLAKVYQSGASEFFGVMWPGLDGQPTFLGRPLSDEDMPPVRIFDPDTALLIEDNLPERLRVDDNLYGAESDFVADCYPEGLLDADLSPTKQRRLLRVIQSAAYRKYCDEQNANQEADNA
jgi:hypothetical protein